ncbi:hypothetical protein [Oscillatoria salina]|uniref:hypothetical protein n=1 Tax=Oscillatoria salina TaxID=331517 RepID=UPI001CCC0B9D|nr:hypothetical protein [Oscillatoria salina]MBZ8179494.1 hypothetical protein [Oscillatoria salina IIICB1]
MMMESRSREDFPLSDSEKMTNEEDLMNLSGENTQERIYLIKEKMANLGIKLTADDFEGLRVYLATEKHWEEVYRRLAES